MLLPSAAAAALLALFFAARYLRLRREVRHLSEALDSRSPIIAPSSVAGTTSRVWNGLVDRLNGMLEQMAVLERQSSGRLHQIDTTLGSLQEGVLIIDRDNYILLANSALQALFPDLAGAVGKRVETGLRSSDFLSFLDQVKRGEGGRSREMAFTQGQKQIWIEISASKLAAAEAGNAPWYLFVLHDITQLKRLESVRKQFVANASHELKTPVSIIKGYAETLMTDHLEMSLEDRDRFLKTIYRHSERLALLVNDLLSLSRLDGDAPTFDWKVADLAQWLRETSQDYQSSLAAAGRPLAFEIAEGAEALVRFDGIKLRQVLDNLVDNALKYTPDGRGLELGARLEESRELEVWVRDEGSGVPPAELERIFQRFYRVDKGRSRETGGTGLGLSIVKRIVEWHEGRIWAENAPEGGLRVAFRLPLVRSESRLAPSK